MMRVCQLRYGEPFEVHIVWMPNGFGRPEAPVACAWTTAAPV